jgi:NADH dehydrogenase
MKTIDDALELRRRVYGALEIAEEVPDPALQRFFLTFAIVGAGPTGVELAGQIRELTDRSLGRVDLQMGHRVVGVDPLGVDTQTADGEKGRFECATTIWAAGVEASPLGALLATATGAETDRAGRISVLPDLSLPGHPEVFAVGDMASINNLPGVAEVAMQGGLHAANTIKRRLNGEESVPFHYRDLGSAAAIGRFKAIASIGGLRLSGFPGWVAWMFVHLAFLNGFGNRFTTMWHWVRSMVGRARPERVFSTGHTGGDLSLPAEVKAKVMPKPFPILEENVHWGDLVSQIEAGESPKADGNDTGTGGAAAPPS